MEVNLERRRFLQRVASMPLGLAVSFPAWSTSVPMVAYIWGLMPEPKLDPPKMREHTKSLDWTNYQGEYNLIFNGGVLNLGVKHAESLFDYYKPYLTQAISKADIVLLEYGDWFEKIGEIAKGLGKDVMCIDPRSVSLELVMSFLSYASVIESIDLSSINLFDKEQRKEWVKAVARAYLYSQLGLMPPSAALSFMTPNDESEYSFKYDISYLFDARTIIMLDRIEKIAKKNPNKKIAVITGDEHAKGFNFYLKKENEELRRRKSALYSIVYYLHKRMADLKI